MLIRTLLVAAALAPPFRPAPPLKVVTSLPTYGAIAREIVGDRATVTSIAQGDEDPHFVQPKPSFVGLLRDADLFVTTGMDLELWVPALLDRAGNRKSLEGGPGYVPAYEVIELLEVQASLSRVQGDIHIARNILAGLKRVSPGSGSYFADRERDFEKRVLDAMIGPALVEALTPATAFELLRTDKLYDFASRQKYRGKPLIDQLRGWLKQG